MGFCQSTRTIIPLDTSSEFKLSPVLTVGVLPEDLSTRWQLVAERRKLHEETIRCSLGLRPERSTAVSTEMASDLLSGSAFALGLLVGFGGALKDLYVGTRHRGDVCKY